MPGRQRGDMNENVLNIGRRVSEAERSMHLLMATSHSSRVAGPLMSESRTKYMNTSLVGMPNFESLTSKRNTRATGP